MVPRRLLGLSMGQSRSGRSSRTTLEIPPGVRVRRSADFAIMAGDTTRGGAHHGKRGQDGVRAGPRRAGGWHRRLPRDPICGPACLAASVLQPPARPLAWDGVRDALAYGPTAPKPPLPRPFDELLPEPAIPGDDCLNLNVWTPDPGRAGLPVMVWVHGGSFVNGSGALPRYAGDRFARDGVVCVTINYRLGCDGFLFLEDVTPNRGLLDQIAALEWVQDNIAAFGGDAGNVTIFGESAGGMSVTTLLAMSRAAGLFRRAIPQSGAGHHVLSPGTARLVTAELADRLGVAATREGFVGVSSTGWWRHSGGFRTISSQVPTRAGGGRPPSSRWHSRRSVDGELLSARPIDAVAGGAGADVDLLVGTNTDEHRLFLVPTGAMDATTDATLAAVAGALGLDATGLAVYTDVDSPGEALAAVLTDCFFWLPAIRLAEATGVPRTCTSSRGSRRCTRAGSAPATASRSRLSSTRSTPRGSNEFSVPSRPARWRPRCTRPGWILRPPEIGLARL